MPEWVRKRLSLPRPNRRWAVAAAIFLVPLLFVPRLACQRGAGAMLAGRREAQEPLVREVARWVEAGVGTDDFNTGSDLFNGEWRFGTYLMAGVGMAQFVEEHGEAAPAYLPEIEACIDALAAPDVRAFDTGAWGNDALETLGGGRGHAAYLGYYNLLLGLHRRLAPGSRFIDLHDRITAALAERIARSPSLIIETYPGQSFPIDTAACIASIAQYDRVAGADHGALVARWVETCRAKYVDPQSGLLYQCVDRDSGRPVDAPRASGTAFGAYFLSFADMAFSRELYEGLKRSCATDWLGFGLVREYPERFAGGRGDIDSGPVVLGMSFSGTGFAISCARIHGDAGAWRALYRTAYLVGAPVATGGRRAYVTGGPLGNAIMLAMLTAHAPGEAPR